MVVDNSSNGLLQKLGRQEFVIPSNVLVLVYGQTVVWTGALFCPLLPLINTFKFIILFYCKKVIRSPRRQDLTLNVVLLFHVASMSPSLWFPLRSPSSTIADRR